MFGFMLRKHILWHTFDSFLEIYHFLQIMRKNIYSRGFKQTVLALSKMTKSSKKLKLQHILKFGFLIRIYFRLVLSSGNHHIYMKFQSSCHFLPWKKRCIWKKKQHHTVASDHSNTVWIINCAILKLTVLF